MNNDVSDLYLKYRAEFQNLQDRLVEDIRVIMKKKNLYLKPVVRRRDKIYGLLTIVAPKSPQVDFEGKCFLETAFMEVGLHFSSLGVSSGLQPLIEEYYLPHNIDEFEPCTEGELEKWQ